MIARTAVTIATAGARLPDKLQSDKAQCQADQAAKHSQIAQRPARQAQHPFAKVILDTVGISIATAMGLGANEMDASFPDFR